jgi:hypothetical protein
MPRGRNGPLNRMRITEELRAIDLFNNEEIDLIEVSGAYDHSDFVFDLVDKLLEAVFVIRDLGISLILVRTVHQPVGFNLLVGKTSVARHDS